jgi:hypothetical protein
MALSLYSQHPAFNLQNFDLQLLIAYTSLTLEMLDYEIQVIRDFVRLKNPVD